MMHKAGKRFKKNKKMNPMGFGEQMSPFNAE
jgi:hypothetical protein